MSKDGISIDFDFGAFNNALKELGKDIDDVANRGLMEAGEQLRGDSTAIVPFDKGFNGGLAGSASVQFDGELSVIVGYNMPYASRLHEDMTLNISQKFAGNGGARQQKYLEKPARENAQKYGRIFSESISKLLNG